MCDLAALLDRRAAMALEADYAAEDADRALERFERGEIDFGDRCYYGDIALETGWDLMALDRGLFALIMATEA